MRTRRALPLGLVAAVLWLLPGPAHAVEMLSLSDVTCGGFAVTGSGLPGDTRLVLAVGEHVSSRPVRSVPVRTDATGNLRATVELSLAGFDEVTVAVLDRADGRTLVIGNHQFASACQPGVPRPSPAAGTLARTGGITRHQLGLLLVGLGLLGAGLLAAATTAYRGSHARGTHAGG